MYMATVSGARIDMIQPDPYSFRFIDIAHGLSREGRFSNQTEAEYSVAQHSLLVYEILAQHPEHGDDPALLLMALLHDGHEFITRDLSTPFAHALDELAPGALDALKARYQDCIWKMAGLTPEETSNTNRHKLVKWADSLALLIEKEDLGVDQGADWPHLGFLHRPSWLTEPWRSVKPMRMADVMSLFMDRFIGLVMLRPVPRPAVDKGVCIAAPVQS
jgi:uncharacterized protein